MRTCSLLHPVAAVSACLVLASCSEPLENTPDTALKKLQETIAENLPKGWQIGKAKDSGVAFTPPTQPDDLLVWKTEKVVLRKKPSMADAEAAAPEPVNVYFTLSVCPFISPEEYPSIYATNKAIKAQHDYWNKTISHIPKSTKGEPMPRGVEESEQVGKYRQEYPKLPPHNPNLPTHYYGVLAFKLRDWRGVQEPEDRKAQTEMNTAFVVITRPLTLYRH